MRPAELNLRAELRALARTSPRIPGAHYRNLFDFVLREGEFFPAQQLPTGVERGFPAKCFHNAIMRAACAGAPYVEGYAINPVAGQPIHHAWNLDDARRVLDTTWANFPMDLSRCAYIGVPFAATRAHDCTWHGDASVIDDYQRGWPLLREPWPGEESPGDVVGLLERILDDMEAEGHELAVTNRAEQLVRIRAHFGGTPGIEERLSNLTAIAQEHMPGAGPVLAEVRIIGCDRCGATADLTDGIPSGWGHGPEGDLCPRCAA